MQARQINADIARISVEAHTAISAVAAVDRELAALTTSVNDIAERPARAAGAASGGKVFAATSAADQVLAVLQALSAANDR